MIAEQLDTITLDQDDFRRFLLLQRLLVGGSLGVLSVSIFYVFGASSLWFLIGIGALLQFSIEVLYFGAKLLGRRSRTNGNDQVALKRTAIFMGIAAFPLIATIKITALYWLASSGRKSTGNLPPVFWLLPLLCFLGSLLGATFLLKSRQTKNLG